MAPLIGLVCLFVYITIGLGWLLSPGAGLSMDFREAVARSLTWPIWLGIYLVKGFFDALTRELFK